VFQEETLSAKALSKKCINTNSLVQKEEAHFLPINTCPITTKEKKKVLVIHNC
jgi:hypothetical protein